MVRIASPLTRRPRLDVHDLELVVALAAAGSTVRAASSLHVTQSAVSRGLLLAEEKLGAPLFERTSRGLVPTRTGERLLEGAGPLLADLVLLETRALAEDDRDRPVPLRVVCECYTAYRWLPSTLARLRRQMKDIEVTLAIEHTGAPLAALLDGSIDVALLTTSALPARARRAFDERPLFADEIVFVVGEGHPLARRPALTPDDLLVHPLVLSTQTPDAERRWFVRRVFGRKTPALRIEPIKLPLTEAIVDAARAGMGIATMSEWIVGPYLEQGSGLVVRRLGKRPLLRPWRIAFRRDLGPAALRLGAAIDQLPPRIYPIAPRARASG